MITIQPREVHELLTSGKHVLLLDVREPFEYTSGHIPGSVNIPVSRFTVNLPQFPKDMLIVTICAHGHRSEFARKALAQKGYDARSMRGGMAEWKWEREI